MWYKSEMRAGFYLIMRAFCLSISSSSASAIASTNAPVSFLYVLSEFSRFPFLNHASPPLSNNCTMYNVSNEHTFVAILTGPFELECNVASLGTTRSIIDHSLHSIVNLGSRLTSHARTQQLCGMILTGCGTAEA